MNKVTYNTWVTVIPSSRHWLVMCNVLIMAKIYCPCRKPRAWT